jgi:hypothetical protein
MRAQIGKALIAGNTNVCFGSKADAYEAESPCFSTTFGSSKACSAYLFTGP